MNPSEWKELGGTSEEYNTALKAACVRATREYVEEEIEFDDVYSVTMRYRDSLLKKVKLNA